MKLRNKIRWFLLIYLCACWQLSYSQELHTFNLGYYLIAKKNVVVGTIHKIGKWDIALNEVTWYNRTKLKKKKIKVRHIGNIENRKNHIQELGELGLREGKTFLFLLGTQKIKAFRMSCAPKFSLPIKNDTIYIEDRFFLGADSLKLSSYPRFRHKDLNTGYKINLAEFQDMYCYLKKKFEYFQDRRKIIYNAYIDNAPPNELSQIIEEALLEFPERYSIEYQNNEP
ncbi:MAG: hypothetical protein HUJ25_14700 [Crocinitomicaceae bacterium]|nr:hypothetical protein [Crocinitomicaceae bacterium]